MIHLDLHHLLDGLDGPPLDADDPDLPARLGDRADARPSDAGLRAAMLAAHARATADAGLPRLVAGVRRDALVRWDDWTSTWAGTHTTSGRPWMLRLLRPHARRDPFLRRRLGLDAAALAGVVPGLAWVGPEVALSGDTPVDPDAVLGIAAPLGGPAFQHAVAGGEARATALASLVVGTLHHLRGWWHVGLGVPMPLDPQELRDAGEHLQIALLTPMPPGDPGPVVAHVAQGLRRWWRAATDHPLADLLDGFVAFPPDDLDEAAQRCLGAMAEHLAEVRHGLARARDTVRLATRRERFTESMHRLEAACPPPVGRAALGVDLDGDTLVVVSDGECVRWGTPAVPGDPVWSADDGFDVPAARRLVRTRGAAPVNARLNAEVQGDPAFADRIARWTSAALEARTIRLLLEATA